MNDDKIVQSVLHDFNNTPSSEKIEKPEEEISFNTAYSTLQVREIAGCNFVSGWHNFE